MDDDRSEGARARVYPWPGYGSDKAGKLEHRMMPRRCTVAATNPKGWQPLHWVGAWGGGHRGGKGREARWVRASESPWLNRDDVVHPLAHTATKIAWVGEGKADEGLMYYNSIELDGKVVDVGEPAFLQARHSEALHSRRCCSMNRASRRWPQRLDRQRSHAALCDEFEVRRAAACGA
eukprot:scaffold7958_cov133-Isochrysis_galbana.AAC.7